MRRWSLLALVPLLVAATITQSGAKDTPSLSTNFSGKAVAKINDTDYFVDTFTCSPPAPTSPPGTLGQLSAKWFYRVDSKHSYYGTLGPGTECALVATIQPNGVVTWSTSSDGSMSASSLTAALMSVYITAGMPALSLLLIGVEARHNYFNPPCSTSYCIILATSWLTGTIHSNQTAAYFPSQTVSYATLDLSVG